MYHDFPLLTQTPREGFVEANMSGRDDPSGVWVVHQVSISVCGVAYQDTSEGCVSHFLTLIGRDVDIGWTSKDSKMAQIYQMAKIYLV